MGKKIVSSVLEKKAVKVPVSLAEEMLRTVRLLEHIAPAAEIDAT